MNFDQEDKLINFIGEHHEKKRLKSKLKSFSR